MPAQYQFKHLSILLFAISLFYLLRTLLFLVYNVSFFLALALVLSRSMTVTSEPLHLLCILCRSVPYRLVSILNLMTCHDHVFLLTLPHK